MSIFHVSLILNRFSFSCRKWRCRYDTETQIWIDINVGMNRTGIVPGEEAIRIYKLADSLPKLKAAGLHVYDGHIHEKDFSLRQKICDEAFVPVQKMRDDLRKRWLSVR